MNRRHAIKLLATAGAGALTVGSTSFAGAVPPTRHPTDSTSWFLVTEDPRADVVRLREALGLRSLESFRLSAISVAPSGQDLTVLRVGSGGSSRIINPSDVSDVTGDLRDFARRLRNRRAPGTTLLSVEPVRPVRRDEITFEVDGRIIDVVPARGSWDQIEITGRQGRTLFRLDDEGLRVTASSCRHELCRRFGARHDGRIICAPNRLVVYLPDASTGLSGITG